MGAERLLINGTCPASRRPAKLKPPLQPEICYFSMAQIVTTTHTAKISTNTSLPNFVNSSANFYNSNNGYPPKKFERCSKTL